MLFFLCAALCATIIVPAIVHAAVFSGNGGLTGDMSGIAVPQADLKTVVIKIVETVLDFVGLVAVIYIIVAGIRLVISQGGDQTGKAWKTIIYVAVGLIVILLARVLVSFTVDLIK